MKNLKTLGRLAKLEGHRAHEEFYYPEFFFPGASCSKAKSVCLSDEEIENIYVLLDLFL